MDHVFLTEHDVAEKARLMATVSPERRQEIISRYMTGYHDGGNVTDLGTLLADSGADFTVEKRPLMAVLGADQAVEVPFKVATVRTDTGQPLGVVGPNYGVVQIRDWFAGAAVLMDRGLMESVSVQVSDNGARVRLTGLVGASTVGNLPEGGPDVLAHFVTFELGHNGEKGLVATFFSIRLVCLNGMTTQDVVKTVSLRHSSNVEGRVTEALSAVLSLNEQAMAEVEEFRAMAAKPLTRAQFRDFATDLLNDVRGTIAEDDEAYERKIRLRTKHIDELEDYFLNGTGADGRTVWGGYNGVTEWVDRKLLAATDSIKAAKHFESVTYGHGNRVKAKAKKLLARY
jgi:hypothetical protein